MLLPKAFIVAGGSILVCGVLTSAQSDFPVSLPPGAMQEKATTACTECHDAHIILQQRLNKGAWTKEVDKMTRWGAVVDPQDRDALIDYLSTNFAVDRPPYKPDRSVAAKTPQR